MTLPGDLPITINPDIVSGAAVFRGTRVPAQTLFDYLADGIALEEFLDHFPSVSRAQAVAALELAKEMLVALAR